MINHSKHVFYHLTKFSGEVRTFIPLGIDAGHIQDHIRDIGHLPDRFVFAEDIFRRLRPDVGNLADRFEETFGIDLRELPTEVSRMLLYFAITATLPGQDPYPHGNGGVSASMAAMEGKVQLAFAMLYKPDQIEQGLELLEEVARQLDQA